ncbi:hypothetical protein KPH14_009172 [Odynerus spinipes]|uniref:Uncharacterized protein n=1 Tax=Odynerus spinipes TaxID=1348599 RepID=A0AAD9RPX7_9HYME|nr:hypothetical protein KPH14_009172 [Odynerus spinipes]
MKLRLEYPDRSQRQLAKLSPTVGRGGLFARSFGNLRLWLVWQRGMVVGPGGGSWERGLWEDGPSTADAKRGKERRGGC